jgi:hypothetical protein
MARTKRAIAFALILAVTACADKVPKEALQLSPESLQERQMQTRRYDTNDEAMLLSSCAALLQDLGFTIDTSETKLGVIVASKDRSAEEIGQIAGSVLLAIAFGVSVPWDEKQKIRASVVTKPVGEDGKSTAVRVTFQRLVWNSAGKVSKEERINEPDFYQQFFAKLSKSVFLEAQQI